MRDSLGLEITDATPAALEHYEQALHELQCFIGDPVATIDKAIAAAPDFVMAHIFKGYLFALATEREAMAIAADCHANAAGLEGTQRERAHVAVLGKLAANHWHEASAQLEDIAIDEPRDALALQVGHQVDFFTGNARLLRDRIARALPAWSPAMPGYHALLGMHAFGLEEMGDYAGAEAEGKRGVELEPRDGWSQHAVAHVMEMQSRQRDGIAWMRSDTDAWTEDSFFQVHNWWHLALFHYDLGEIDEVLKLYDGPIYGPRSPLAINMVDASALLWRLSLRGIDVGQRWGQLAANWAPKAGDRNYAFNDLHAVMAFVGAGDAKLVDTVIEAQKEAMKGHDDNVAFTRDVGHPLTLAFKAFGEGNYRETIRLMRPIRGIANRFGGSHAQRDVIDLTLIEAALRAGDAPLSRALAAERHAARPASPLSQLFVQRAAA
jgi:hypothetical protein